MIRVDADKMETLVAATFVKAGCADDEAARIGKYLTGANLTGHDSHGVVRVPRYYEWLRDGRVFAGRHVQTELDSGSLLIVDGCQGFGQTVGPEAAALGIQKCQAHGVALVALKNAGHLGRIGDFAEMAAAKGLVSVHFVNVHNSLLVAPFGGRERRFSTNPIAIGVPNEKGRDFILDFATSSVAEGKVLVAHQGGKPVPEDALVAPTGALSNDTTLLYGNDEGGGYPDPRLGPGALRTFGEHKGSGLALACELLAGALTGSGVNKGVDDTIHNGMLSIYIDPNKARCDGGFGDDVEEFLQWVCSAKPSADADAVLVPGDKERETRSERMANGLPIAPATLDAIIATAISVGVPAEQANALKE